MLRFRDLENLDKDNLFDLLEGISEEQVENSDVGGDSDAEDGPSSTLTTTSNDRSASRSPELANELIGASVSRKRRDPLRTRITKVTKVEGRAISCNNEIRQTNVHHIFQKRVHLEDMHDAVLAKNRKDLQCVVDSAM
ncbi:hypothetical protein QE152_g24432 [Popillia japonica]|uniref:Uncharacterized protein n=1 Tax=Popillia japonica TaxID=7064 RepID=A0AAW1KFC9_POPJA